MGVFTALFRKAMKPAIAESEEVLSRLKTPNTGLKSFDEAFGSINFTKENLTTMANGVPLHTLDRSLRRGELISLFRKLDKPNTITYADELKFRNMLDTPDVELKNLDDTIKTGKVLHPDLDVVPTDTTTLSTASKRKLVGMFDALRKSKTVKTVGGTTLAIGLTATIVLGPDYYRNLVKATKSRNGVFVLIRTNDKTSSYKITSRSCVNSESPANGIVFTGTSVELDNVALYLLYTINGTDESERERVSQLVGFKPTMDRFSEILDNTEYFSKIRDYYYSTGYTGPSKISNPCNMVSDNLKVDASIKYPCLAWDGSASENNLTYYNPYNLPDNMTLTCITNSTMIETIIDAAGSVAHAIIGSNFSTRIAAYVKYVIIAIVVLVGAAVVRIVYMKYKALRGRDEEHTPLMEED